MADVKTMIERAYSAFNRRDIDGALALMTEDVSWPKASEGAKLSVKKRSAPIGLVNGVSSMAMSTRLE
jgi:ketosteroid isomerase-like protein